MIELDGIEYSLNTPEENCNNAVTFINEYCAAHNVTNTKGEIIFIKANTANPLYMIIYGLSYLVSILQKLIFSVGASISVPHSSDSQLLNLADIAQVKRKKATKTIIRALVTSDLPEENAVSCNILPSLSVTIPISSGNIVFHPATEYIIPPGQSANITLIAEQEGSYSISAGAFTSFDTPVDGLRSLTAYASEPGKAQESIQALRQRLQSRAINGTQLDRAADAIEQLDGVNNCNIYFNYDAQNAVIIGKGANAMTVEPRKALLLVQGYNEDIAHTYYNHVICETQQESSSEIQYYTTHAGQQLPVYITPPTPVDVGVHIYLGEEVGYEQSLNIKDTILGLVNQITIGQKVTSAAVINILKEAYPSLSIASAEVAVLGDSYSYIAQIAANEIASFNTDNILITQVSI